ncbi:gephyrin-like molybdotransferase Glp [Halothiobacillus sp. DCM-1]|uniref:molybdopterin molybdotransferase MoeA n=1 Tax=Halothiobacillus sp. DCM-1 TaxID=3112558 RepID=UPI00324FED9B
MESLSSAQHRLVAQMPRIADFEWVPVREAAGRYLAVDVVAEQDVPSAPVSLFDGYALHAPAAVDWVADVAGTTFAGEPAGQLPNQQVVWRIFTGAPLPVGANAVVAQESTVSAEQGQIVLKEAMKPGAGVRPQGADSQRGARVLAAGHRLDAAALALLTSVGRASVPVVRRPRVAVFTTGDELVEPGQPLPPGKIYDANHPLLSVSLARLGAEVVDLGVLPDDLAAIKSALIEQAGRVDLLLTSGGVSVGDADLVRAAVSELGSIDAWRVFLKPGKPLAYGRVGQTPFIGLPGNPVSTFVTFQLFVRPALRAIQGADAGLDSPVIRLPLATDYVAGDRPEFIRVRRVLSPSGETALEIFPNQNSGLLSSLAWADGVALVPPDQRLSAGSPVDYFPFDGWFS